MRQFVKVNGERYQLRPKWDGSRELELVPTETIDAHVAIPRKECEELRSILRSIVLQTSPRDETIVSVEDAMRAVEILDYHL